MKPSHVGHSVDAAIVELRRRLDADAPQPLDGQRMKERELLFGRNHEKPVGLGDAACDLREELGAGDANGDRKADALEDPGAKADCDLGRRSRQPAEATDVEKGLVDRDAFDERRRVVEHLEHGLAGFGVRVHAGRDHDRLRAEEARLPSAHRRVHAERLRLVARREHDAPAHDHRTALQRGVVALLDRRVERVEVGMEDRRLGAVEHMFVDDILRG